MLQNNSPQNFVAGPFVLDSFFSSLAKAGSTFLIYFMMDYTDDLGFILALSITVPSLLAAIFYFALIIPYDRLMKKR